MECPKCKKTVGERDLVGKNCGIALKEKPKKAKGFKELFTKKKSGSKDSFGRKTSSAGKVIGGIVSGKNEKKIRIALLAALAVLLVVLIWVLAVRLSADEGEKRALEAAEFVGQPITAAEEDMEIHFKDNSDFSILNNAAVFDYIYESEDNLEIEDIVYPEWTVTVLKDSSDNIETVTYTNYKQLESDSRGEKLDSRINLDSFNRGARYSSVSDAVGLDPYKIVYGEDSISYIYKYYYTAADGNAQSVVLTVVFDSDSEYLYYTSVNVYPQNI